MNTLDDAWQWYSATRQNLHLFQRLVRNYWEVLPWEGRLAKDNTFRGVEQGPALAGIELSVEHIDDLAIVVIFSVFEMIVRDGVMKVFRTATPETNDPVVLKAIKDARDGIERGSFYHNILDPYKH